MGSESGWIRVLDDYSEPRTFLLDGQIANVVVQQKLREVEGKMNAAVVAMPTPFWFGNCVAGCCVVGVYILADWFPDISWAGFR